MQHHRSSLPIETPESVPPDLVGSEFGSRYRIDARLGAGGFGVVYRAWDRTLDRRVALKVLRAELAANSTQKRRFAREAKALMAVEHPNIVTITDYGVMDEVPYLAMELLEGRGLDCVLKQEGPLSEQRATFVFSEMLSGIGYMHDRHLLHRDLKPGNVFVQQLGDGRECIKLLDLGLAKFLEGEGETELATLTRTGQVFGTPAFMPPEQLGGAAVDRRADLYSAVVVMFQMLSGRRPFEGEPHEVLRKVLVETAPPLATVSADVDVHPALEAWFQRSMDKDPGARHPTAATLLAALETIPRPWLRNTNDVTTGLVWGSLSVADTVLQDSAGPVRSAERKVARSAGFASFMKEALRRTMVASAALISLASVLVIGVAASVIYVLTGDGPNDAPRALPREPSAAGNVMNVAGVAAVGLHPIIAAVAGDEVAADGNAVAGGHVAAAVAAPVEPAVPDEAVAHDEVAVAASGAKVVAIDVVAGDASALVHRAAPDEEVAVVDEASAAAANLDEQGVAADPPEATVVTPALATLAPSGRVRARDPFRRGTPKALRSIRRRLARGHAGDERTIKVVRRYNRSHPKDPRGHLLMARLYMNRRWYGDAVHQYGFAHTRDAAARGDRHMLRDLVRLVSEDSAHAGAARLVRDAYGPEAIKTVERARRRAKEARTRRRLARLRRRLGDPA